MCAAVRPRAGRFQALPHAARNQRRDAPQRGLLPGEPRKGIM